MSTARALKRRQRMSADAYLAGPPDELKGELIYGEMVLSPSPSDKHQDLQADLGYILRQWVRAFELGWVWHDLDMVLDQVRDLVYRPDLIFLSRDHEERRQRGRVIGPADLCVEILSPSDRPRVQRLKYRDYARYGVPWYWIVNPGEGEPVLEENQLVEQTYTVRSETVGDAWFSPALFPGLQIRLPALIQGNLKAAVKGKAKKLV